MNGFDDGENCIDELEIRRLTDGRLDGDERDALLQWAEDHPVNWRAIALAFVEEQSLRRLLPESDLAKASTKTTAASRVLRPLAWAMAACLCVCAAGWAGTSYGQQLAAENAPPPKDPETYVVWTTAKPVEQPSAWDEAVSRVSRPLLDDEIRQSLLRAGVVAEERPTIHLISGPGGRSIPVPERELIFRPVSVNETDVSKPESNPFSEGKP